MPTMPEARTGMLGEARPGATVRVVRVEGEAALSRRLREMGFCEQAEVRVASVGAQVVCHVRGSRVGLSRGLAESIVVSGVEAR